MFFCAGHLLYACGAVGTHFSSGVGHNVFAVGTINVCRKANTIKIKTNAEKNLRKHILTFSVVPSFRPPCPRLS